MIPVAHREEGPGQRPPFPPTPEALAAAVWAAYGGDRVAARDALARAAGILEEEGDDL